MLHRSPFEGARVARHGRRYAKALIDSALLVFEARQPTAAELADLADAADAFGRGRYDIAVVLTEAAIEGRSHARSAWLPTMTRSLDDVRAIFAAAAQAGAAGAYQNF